MKPRIFLTPNRFIGSDVNCLIRFGMSLALCCATAHAATWDGDTSANWSDAGNWDTAPSATGSSVVFTGSSNTTNNNNLAVTSVSSLTFDSGASAFTLTGSALTGATITNNSSNLQTINLAWSGNTTVNAASGDITLARYSGATLASTGSHTLNLGTQAPGSVQINVSGGGTVKVNSTDNTNDNIAYNVAINNGTLQLLRSNQMHYNTPVTLNGGASSVLDYNGYNDEVGKLQGTGGIVTNSAIGTTSLITIGGGNNSSDFSNILLQNGAGTLALTTRRTGSATPNTYTMGAANTFTGKMTIGDITNVSVLANGGVASSIGAGSNSSANLAISTDSTLRYTGSSTSTNRGFTTGSATSSKIEVVNAGTNLEFTSASIGGFTKTGAGTLILSGNVSGASAPSVTQGTLVLNASGNSAFSGSITVGSGGTMKLGSASTGDMIHDNTSVTVNGGGMFDMGGKSEKVKNISGTGTFLNSGSTQSTLTVSGYWSSSVFGGAITGNIALTHSDGNGSSTTLNGLNTYSGNTTIGVGDATFNLGPTGGLTFYIGDNGVNNWINGASGATVNLDGQFAFDLTNAGIEDDNFWNIVEVGDLVETFGSTFAVTGFTEASNVWTKLDGSNTWTFSESTGVLSLAVVPEPGTALLGSLGIIALLRRRV